MSSNHDSYTTSISNFVRWAADRIEQEIETNERCKKEHGSAEVFKDSYRLPSSLSDSDKHNYIKEVERVSKANPSLTRPAACEISGVHYTTFYKWKKQLKEKGIIK
jgi:hypothetical protein